MKKYIPFVLMAVFAVLAVAAVVTRPDSPDDISQFKYRPEVSHQDAAALVERINAACGTYRYGGRVYHGHTEDWTIGDEISGMYPKGTVKVSCSQDHAEDDYEFKTWVVAVSR